MSKETVTNTWKDGLNKDLNPMITPNTVLTDNLNGTLITYNGNEFSLQNDMGNVKKGYLSEGFYPIGVKEFGGIMYFVSVNENTNEFEIGSYPSLNPQTHEMDVESNPLDLEFQYRPLHNLYSSQLIPETVTREITETTTIPVYSINLWMTDEMYLDELVNDIGSVVWDQGSLPLTLEDVRSWIDNYRNDNQMFDYLPDNTFYFLSKDWADEVVDYIAGSYPDWIVLVNSFSSSKQITTTRTVEETVYHEETALDIFRTNILNTYDKQHPVTIEVQPSYDGSVNLILNDNKNVQRLINSGFAVLGDGKGKFTKRNQNVRTNYYDLDKVDLQTRLINTSTKFTHIDLGSGDNSTNDGVQFGGELNGGNYTFYLKYGDEDGNQTDIICESGTISIFKGTPGDPFSMSGAFANEKTDKSIYLTIKDVDTNYSNIYLYYTREYCDLNGYRLVEAKALIDPYQINSESKEILITGVEREEDISIEELNVAYYSVSSAKAIAQQQNMLFLGNIKQGVPDTAKLQNLSYRVIVGINQTENVGYVEEKGYKTTDSAEYYSPKNIYYKLGYWPNELYRFGIVYIKEDGTKTDAFNLYGCAFRDSGDTNATSEHQLDVTKVEDNDVFVVGGSYRENIKGVFKLPSMSLYSTNSLFYPIGLSFTIPSEVQLELAELGIVGYFIVRQKRIPITICQGFSVGISENAYIPMLYWQDSDNGGYAAESFITNTVSSDGEGPYDRLLINSSYYSTSSAYTGKYFAYVEFKNNQMGRKTKTAVGIFGYKESRGIYADGSELPATQSIYSQSGSDDLDYYKGFYDTPPQDSGTYGNRLPMFDYCYELIVYKKGDSKTVDAAINALKASEYASGVDFDNPKYGTSPINVDLGSSWISTQVVEDKAWSVNSTGIEKVNKYKLQDQYWSYKKIAELDGNVAKQISTGKMSIVVNYESANVLHVNRTAFHIYKGLQEDTSTRFRYVDSISKNTFGLLSVEARTTPEIQSKLDGSEFYLNKDLSFELDKDGLIYYTNPPEEVVPSANVITSNAIYVPEDTPLKYINGVSFSTKVGSNTEPSKFGFLNERPFGNASGSDSKTRDDLVRGAYTDYIGIYNSSGYVPTTLYNVRVKYDPTYKLEFLARGNNQLEYYAVTDKTLLKDSSVAYRGDCYTNTVTVRMHRNFIDPTAPLADVIVDPYAWRDGYKGLFNKETDWENDINITDLNTVDLGHWVTFKCLASSNLALRSLDTTNVTEFAQMGNPRGFYPVTGASTATPMKVADTTLYNDGYRATVGRIRQILKQKTPYDKNEYGTRVMFSNVATSDAFINGYRTFQGASFKDYPTQYGKIIKLLPWGNNLFCVFEHGIAIIPVNQKALMNTTTDQTIHIYGYGVLPDDLSIVSQDYGSIWADSVIKTPLGIYGVDTSAKKIWQFTDRKGLVTISDMKIQRFLNDEINIGLKSQEDLGVTNVKTHYNEYKGDVMFTFYNTDETRKEWNICYNERQGLWITRYSWIPLHSANVDNTFYTIELHKYSDSTKESEQNRPFGIWKHGRTGLDNQLILPTKWYNIQEPFEFEFVAGEPMGIDKIFENLKITSNNVQPESFDFQIIGDDYLFNKARMYHDVNKEIDKNNIYGDPIGGWNTPYNTSGEQFTKQDYFYDNQNFDWAFYNASITYDKVLDEYTLVVHQDCKNKEKHGIRLGNIQYKENGWDTNIEPLRYNAKLKNPEIELDSMSPSDPFVSAKLRDKWIKIRIKYKGDRLAIIGAVTTFENISYA